MENSVSKKQQPKQGNKQ